MFEQTKVIADAGYHSAASVSYTQQSGIDAYVADRSHRQRDPAFADYDRYKIRFRKDNRRYYGTDSQRFTAKDFIYDENDRSCRCPAGNRLYGNGTNIKIHGFLAMKFRGAKSVCGPCLLREQCLKTPERTETKQMTIFIGRTDQSKDSPIEKMKRKFDTLFGRFIYNKRIAIVEPVFANLTLNVVNPTITMVNPNFSPCYNKALEIETSEDTRSIEIAAVTYEVELLDDTVDI